MGRGGPCRVLSREGPPFPGTAYRWGWDLPAGNSSEVDAGR